MTSSAIQLNVYPTYAEVRAFLGRTVPRLIASGLTVDYDPSTLEETEDGYAKATIAVFDEEEAVFPAKTCVVSYELLCDLADVLERKQVELQLWAMQARFCAVNWRLKVELGDVFIGDLKDQKLKLIRDGKEEDFIPNYANLRQLRQDLIRTEAIQLVQSYWLELENAGHKIQITDGYVLDDCNGTHRYGLAVEEVQDLIDQITPAQK